MDLFTEELPTKLEVVPDTYLLKGFALEQQQAILSDLREVISQSPFRRMVTPGGFTMSVAMSNCGKLGWVTDKTGYRYTTYDPLSDEAWPAMPDSFNKLAQLAATQAGYGGFVPDACLINRYNVGARMSLHQDKNELDFRQPIVSVSLGLPATFQLGGFERTDKPIKIPLEHGDVLVWGDASRMRYHGILPLKPGMHIATNPALHECRINLTFRKAG